MLGTDGEEGLGSRRPALLALAVERDERAGDVRGAGGIDERDERELGAVIVPQRPAGVARLARKGAVDAPVAAAVAAVRILDRDRRLDV